MRMNRQLQPYLKNSFKSSLAATKAWKLFENAQGCTLLDTQGIALSMTKSPPPLVTDSPGSTDANPITKAPSAPKPTPQKDEPPLLVAAWKEMQGWAARKGEDGKPKVEAFDLYDLPIGMHAEGFTVSEAFARRWLNGRAYSAYVANANGEMIEGRYDKDMIDTDTVKLSWLLRFTRVQEKYNDLLSRVGNSRAFGELTGKFRNFLARNPSYTGMLNTLAFCQNDLQDSHRQFQFQYVDVSVLDTAIEVTASGASHYGMTDLTASLGSFALYATVAAANIKQDLYNKYNTPTGTQHCTHVRVEVTHIYVYARDTYSFHDKGQSSQYLGHWNKNGVIVLLKAAAASFAATSQRGLEFEAGNETVPPYAADIVGRLLGKDIYYPIRNRDFRNWRELKGRGGDFLVYSDIKKIKLDTPISLDLGEVCR